MNAIPPRTRHLDRRTLLGAGALAAAGLFAGAPFAAAQNLRRAHPHGAQRLALAEVRKT